jgi:ParB family chromosome partitioning protein
LTPFEEADGLQRLAEQFEYTHDDIAKKIAKARSSVTETMSLRVIPEAVRKRCLELGIISKSLLLQVARQPNERKMLESVHRIAQGGLTRDEARRERQEEKNAGPRPQPFIFNYHPESEAFRLRIQFRKSNVSRGELIASLRSLLEMLEQDQRSSPDTDKANPAVA